MQHTAADDLEFFRGTLAVENEIWVADLDGRIVGLLALGAKVVRQLFVEPELQGRGVGGALLDKAKQLSPSGLTLYTFRKNEPARRFYENRGFEVVEYGVSAAPESEPDVLYEWRP